MPAIHLIKKHDGGLPPIQKVPGEQDTYTSGFWMLSEEKARTLLNGRIYFHERQLDPSFFGGTIIAVETAREGDYAGRIVFTFIASADCRNVRAGPGWSQEMKFDGTL